MIKRLLIIFTVIFSLSFCTVWAQDDIEVTDSTSTDWSGGGGGGLNPQTPTGPVTSMTLSQSSVSLEGGQSVRLVATFNADAANKNVTWTSADSKIATVDAKGNVSALAKGSTVITATATGNTSIKQTCNITVTRNIRQLGDVNDDGVIDTQDAIKVTQHYLGKQPSDFDVSAADVNDDGVVDTQDAIKIIRIYLNKE